MSYVCHCGQQAHTLHHLCVDNQVAADQLIAGTGADAALVPLAASYMRIRALAQPAVLLTMVCQGGLLAQQVCGLRTDKNLVLTLVAQYSHAEHHT